MEVPFVSSGAMSRAHYALVRKVETSASIQSQDQYLLDEIKAARNLLGSPGLSLKQCKESLVILLYCFMTATPGFFVDGTFDFALRYAVNLAEAGRSIAEKRIGYLFCAEVMPPSHELQLMLVNTLRKDLESSAIPRICLALDNLIKFSNEDVIPAVQSRLHDLISHNSSHVRRRSLLAFRSLARHDSEILKRVSNKVSKRLKDPQRDVASAAFLAACDMQSDSLREFRPLANSLFAAACSNLEKTKYSLLLRILRSLFILGLSESNISIVLDLIQRSSNPQDNAILLGAFHLISQIPSQTLVSLGLSQFSATVRSIVHILASRDPNDKYLFLSCLECVDPIAWAGTTPGNPPALEKWEVEQVMQLLDSSDSLIRRKALKVMNRVDSDIIASYYSQSLETMPTRLSIQDKNEYAARLLEVLEIYTVQDGELYARRLFDLFGRLENALVGGDTLETAVEMVLVYVRHSNITFRIGCATTLLTFTTELTTVLGSNLMVIVSALAAEYCGKTSIAPISILKGISSRLSLCSPAVQDACLIAMLRVAADCVEVPIDVIESIEVLAQTSGRHIKRRCALFIRLSTKPQDLAGIVSSARSTSLPDFLDALLIYVAQSEQRPIPSHSPTLSSVLHSPPPTSKLRYAAYETPPPAARLRSRRPSGSAQSVSSSNSGILGHLQREHATSSLEMRLAKELQNTSDLIASVQEDGATPRAASGHKVDFPKTLPVEDLNSRMDLIAFDLPYVTESSASRTNSEPAFETLWNSLDDSNGARGWCDISVDDAVRRLEGLDDLCLEIIKADRPPFTGDLKVLITASGHGGEVGTGRGAALRLRGSEEESCLWRLRCGDAETRIRLKHVLR